MAEGPVGIRTLRIVDRMVHTSYHNRIHHRDITLENCSPEPRRLIVLRIAGFLRNLKVLDADGSRLPIVPSAMLDSMDQVYANTPTGKELKAMRDEDAHLLGFVLPEERQLAPGDVRVVTLTYIDEDETAFCMDAEQHLPGPLSASRRSRPTLEHFDRWTRTKFRVLFLFFSVPRFRAAVVRKPGDPHDEHVVVDPLDDHEVRGSAACTADHVGRVHDNIRTRGKSLAHFLVPPAEERPCTWSMTYWMVPQRKFTFMALSAYWSVAAAALLAVAGMSLSSIWNEPIPSWESTLLVGVPGAIVVNSLALMYAIDQPWMDRYTKRLVVLVVVGLGELLAWTVRLT